LLTIEVLNSASWLIPKKVEGCCGWGCSCVRGSGLFRGWYLLLWRNLVDPPLTLRSAVSSTSSDSRSLVVWDSGNGLTLELQRFEVCGTSAPLPVGVAFDRELLFGTFKLEFNNFSMDSSEVPGPSDFELRAPTEGLICFLTADFAGTIVVASGLPSPRGAISEVRFLASVFAVLLLDVDPFSFTLELEREKVRDSEGPELEFP